MKSVWLYTPNLIGYFRILSLLCCILFSRDTESFFVCYGVSYLLDAVDGPLARALGELSQFGAVLDMVTDRVSTALLLCLLAHDSASHNEYNFTVLWHFLLLLDIGAHWVQMYSALLSGATSHKSLQDEPFLLTWYYRRHNLFWVCLLSETHLVMSLLLVRGEIINVPVLRVLLPWGVPLGLLPWGDASTARSIGAWLWAIGAPVCAFKQLISVVHLMRASQRVVALDHLACQEGRGLKTPLSPNFVASPRDRLVRSTSRNSRLGKN